MAGLPWLQMARVRSRQAVAGASEPNHHAARGITRETAGKSRRSSLADARRGCHERKRASSKSVSGVGLSFISHFFQLIFDFL